VVHVKFFGKATLLITAGVIVASLFGGCGAAQPTPEATPEATPQPAAHFTIGIDQIAPHPALDAARQGFIDELAAAGYVDGDNVTLDIQNAQGDQSNLDTISQKFVDNNYDLVYAIATSTAQSIAGKTKTIPIVVSAVTDPADAGLVTSNDSGGTNVTGASDLTPVAKQFDLIKKLFPDATSVGIVYSSGEPNSQVQVDLAKSCAAERGLTIETVTIASENDLQQAAEALCGKNIQVIWEPTDNNVADAMPILAQPAIDHKIPIVGGEDGQVQNGALITDGVDYYNLGKLAGDMAIKILKGESKPQDMPIQYLQDTKISVNQKTADALGITIPDDLLAGANIY